MHVACFAQDRSDRCMRAARVAVSRRAGVRRWPLERRSMAAAARAARRVRP
ncbi:hypothetical protein BURMUCGD1_3861 [Burkholderia multivorans CGD1]|nr:hypothetical protein BURMUCGD1_3861 [Burkholderia multivorans CGD1]